jgi:hypothetical protein
MRRAVTLVLASAFLFSTSFALDVQYTEEQKITGGAATGAMKMAGIFSKDARQAMQGSTMTVSLKGNKMRHESSLGTAQIFDLDARRVIDIDLKHKTYSVTTFEQMKEQLAEAKRKAAEEQAKRAGKKGDDTKVTIKPKISITPGTGSKEILNYTAKETKVRVDMEMEAQDSKGNNQSGNTWVNSDNYVAPVKGYEEVKRFYMKMAKELDWVPGAVMQNNPNFQINQPMVEYKKRLNEMNGMPLLSYVSVGMGPNPGTTGQNAAPTPEKKEGNAITKGLGGMMGGFGRHKPKDSSDDDIAKSGSPQTGGSLMDMTTTVTSVSNSPVDAALFDVPAGFKQVEKKEPK